MTKSTRILYCVFCFLATLGNVLPQAPNNQEYYKLLARTGTLDSPIIMKYVVSVIHTGHETSYPENHVCTGAIITRQEVVVAAHCLFANDSSEIDPSELVVMAGFEYGSIQDKSVQKLTVRKTVLHENFKQESLANDIGILILEGAFDFITHKIQQVEVPRLSLVEYKLCSLLGFGIILFKDMNLPHLLEQKMRIWPMSTCQKYLRKHHIDPKGKFCAGHLNAQAHDPCKGFASGPMVCNHNVYGLSLFSIGCHSAYGVAAVFTDISYYHDWVVKHATEGRVLLSRAPNLFGLSNVFGVKLCLIVIFFRLSVEWIVYLI